MPRAAASTIGPLIRAGAVAVVAAVACRPAA